MRFIDANVFLYSFLTKQQPSTDEKMRRQLADKILADVDKGQKVITTVVHLSEIANIIEDRLQLGQQKRVFESIFLNEFIEVKQVDRQLYGLAVEYAMDNKMGVNDALAVLIMQKENITEIYSFDSGYDDVTGIVRLTQ